jgi:hypothetical protein
VIEALQQDVSEDLKIGRGLRARNLLVRQAPLCARCRNTAKPDIGVTAANGLTRGEFAKI